LNGKPPPPKINRISAFAKAAARQVRRRQEPWRYKYSFITMHSPLATLLICRSGKPATPQQVLIINDLSGNKIGNRPATDRQHFAPFWEKWINHLSLTNGQLKGCRLTSNVFRVFCCK
jgi:hypothetical protein